MSSESKRQRVEPNADVAADTQDVSKFLKSWTWKREHRTDRERFHRPYTHTVALPDGSTKQLTISQAKFKAIGFASTVWDSSIVASKALEAHPELVAGKSVLDLSAGCGLVGIVAATLGAERVVSTDLEANLQLLSKNCETNCPGKIQVLEHAWGHGVTELKPPFDVVLAQDVMYVREAVPDLVKSLVDLTRVNNTSSATRLHDTITNGEQHTRGSASSEGSAFASTTPTILLSHGRNRFAEDEFMALARQHFSVTELQEDELHPDYQCSDVTVYKLVPLPVAT